MSWSHSWRRLCEVVCPMCQNSRVTHPLDLPLTHPLELSLNIMFISFYLRFFALSFCLLPGTAYTLIGRSVCPHNQVEHNGEYKEEGVQRGYKEKTKSQQEPEASTSDHHTDNGSNRMNGSLQLRDQERKMLLYLLLEAHVRSGAAIEAETILRQVASNKNVTLVYTVVSPFLPTPIPVCSISTRYLYFSLYFFFRRTLNPGF